MAFSIDTSIAELLDNPAALAVINKHMPNLATNPQIDTARSMGLSLKGVADYSAGKITPEILAAVAKDLSAL